jgi:hypothetical protein
MPAAIFEAEIKCGSFWNRSIDTPKAGHLSMMRDIYTMGKMKSKACKASQLYLWNLINP